ncbi:hypothetical protein LDENG_00258520 [Lucifuga dentata]|nr:hypothetical protein LDENG_00258520 [Lucifuga dentata]
MIRGASSTQRKRERKRERKIRAHYSFQRGLIYPNNIFSLHKQKTKTLRLIGLFSEDTSAAHTHTTLQPRFFFELLSGKKTEVVGLECVLMAESETECDTPGLDTLGSECVIAHSHVDLHYGAETEIMTEEKRGLELEIHGSELKIQGLGPELGAVACVDAIVETDHDYIKVEHGEMHCFTGAEIKTTGNEALLGEVLLKTESEHVVKVESDHGGELTVESENGVIIHEAHGLQCNECGEIFGSIADLHQHFEIHKDLNPYICVHCGESFAVEASLKQHMKIHMKEKPYIPGVEIMGKDVIDAFSLKSHQMIHLPEKPHRCSECGRASFAEGI